MSKDHYMDTIIQIELINFVLASAFIILVKWMEQLVPFMFLIIVFVIRMMCQEAFRLPHILWIKIVCHTVVTLLIFCIFLYSLGLLSSSACLLHSMVGNVNLTDKVRRRKADKTIGPIKRIKRWVLMQCGIASCRPCIKIRLQICQQHWYNNTVLHSAVRTCCN